MGKFGETNRLANAGLPGVLLRVGDDALASLPIAMVVMVLALLADTGETIELPSVNSRLAR